MCVFIFMYFVLEGSVGRQLHATCTRIPAATHAIRYCNFGALLNKFHSFIHSPKSATLNFYEVLNFG